MIDETYKFAQEDINQGRGLAVVSYIGFLFFIPLIVKPMSPYVKFHANQGLVNFIFGVILAVISQVVANVLGFIPFFGWIFHMLAGIITIPALIFAIMGIVNAVQGTAKRLPVIGNIDLIK